MTDYLKIRIVFTIYTMIELRSRIYVQHSLYYNIKYILVTLKLFFTRTMDCNNNNK